MTGDDAVDDIRAALRAALGRSRDGVDAVSLLGRMVVQSLPVDGVSISVTTTTDVRETLYTSDESVARLEALQFSLGEGPCFEASATLRPVLVADLFGTPRTTWPIFASELRDESVAAIFAFPLVSGATAIGVLGLYSAKPGWLSVADVAVALRVVDAVTSALLEMNAGGSVTPWWTDLPTSSPHIHQATGMLIAALHIPADQALARLRGYAYTTGQLVDDVADALVTRRLAPADLDGR